MVAVEQVIVMSHSDARLKESGWWVVEQGRTEKELKACLLLICSTQRPAARASSNTAKHVTCFTPENKPN